LSPKKAPLYNLLKRREYDALALGLMFPISILLGLGIGYFLDRIMNTSPIFMIIFLVYGIAAAFVSYYRVTRTNDSKK
jgi:F0F1-type ATP synthase assembly protein I